MIGKDVSTGGLRRADGPVRVLYVMGSGRSGSTVLASVLGNHPDAFTVGEISFLPRHGWLDDGYCACGLRAGACPLWSEVRRRWCAETGATDLARYDALAWATEREPQGRLLGYRRKPSPAFEEYACRTESLLRAIRAVSGRPVLVDSSKGPGRALALSAIPGVDLRVVYLVRDVRGVIWSLKKRLAHNARAGVRGLHEPRRAWRSALGWLRLNRRALSACGHLDRVTRVRYEDLVARPDGVLEEIGRLAGLDFRPVARDLAAGRPLEIGHLIAGNRMRMAGSVRLKPDVEWMTGLTAADRWTAWAMTGRLLKRFGYEKQPSGPLSREDDFPREAAA